MKKYKQIKEILKSLYRKKTKDIDAFEEQDRTYNYRAQIQPDGGIIDLWVRNRDYLMFVVSNNHKPWKVY